MTRTFILTGALVFSVYTLNCLRQGGFWKGLGKTWNTLWGRQFLVDLNVGFLLWGLIYYALERDVGLAALYWVLTVVCGNIFPLFYLFFNYAEIMARLG